MRYEDAINRDNIPTHVAIIMDGNGRWAKARGMHRALGHQQGVEAVKRVTEKATEIGVKYLTLYTFSTENWNRPAEEVIALMNLVLDALETEIFVKNNVRFRCIGDRTRLPKAVCQRIEHTEQTTAVNNRMTMIIALSYSSRWELTESFRLLAQQIKEGTLQPEQITEQHINNSLQTAFMPDPDLLIRTGGEQRISNYLLWQCAYSELYFSNDFWPDFNGEALCQAIYSYQQRQRRFGQTGEQIEAANPTA
ncbi:MAG: isoprenyl transferase [Bacteroidales bacterium]|nr:isoprenyl transferase [Bacteroidales bacterium]